MAKQSYNSPRSVLPLLVPLASAILTAQFLGSDAINLRLPFLQIYWLAANLSILHIPNYRIHSAGWRQHNQGEKWREKPLCDSSVPPHLPKHLKDLSL